jgi:ATP-dependent DNA helicase DinG
LSGADIEQMKKYFEALKIVFKEYLILNRMIARNLKSIDKPSNSQVLLYKKVMGNNSKVENVIKKCDSIFEGFNKEYLYFLNKELLENYQNLDKLPVWVITKTPINLGEIFQKYMFKTCDHVIALSATISTNGNFDFYRSRLGFKPTDVVQELIVDSPFDYYNQGKAYLFENSPDASDPSFEDFIVGSTENILQKTRGGTFILFTSNASMKRCYDRLVDKIENELNIKCLMQGQDSKSVIIRKFREYQKPGSGYKSAILFAGSSFWEGVSVEGDDLMNVIITKLPFPVPNDPIINARCEYLKEKGINPFSEYMVPLAIIPLKQGFGRLIRTIHDRGNIFMFDNRLVKAKYKDQILNSLPRFQYIQLKV